jgi:hypothetical protein
MQSEEDFSSVQRFQKTNYQQSNEQFYFLSLTRMRKIGTSCVYFFS